MLFDNCYDTCPRARHRRSRSLHGARVSRCNFVLRASRASGTLMFGIEHGHVEFTSETPTDTNGVFSSFLGRRPRRRRTTPDAPSGSSFVADSSGRNCRHRRPINITSLVARSTIRRGSSASDRKAPIIIHSSLNRPPTRQLRLPVRQVHRARARARTDCAFMHTCVNVCSCTRTSTFSS